MPRTRKPRAGSMQFWPRVRAKKTIPRIRNWAANSENKLLGFAGYKAGMTHIIINDSLANSLTKGKEIFCPVTVIECPPIKTASIRFYKQTQNSLSLLSELFAESLDKDLSRRITNHNKKGKEPEDYDLIRVLCYTQPKLTGIGKKIPEIFEIAVGGTKEQQASYAKEKLGKEISINEAFKEGQILDSHSLTKGKGFQGPMKRFGVQLRHHKSEKSRRNPGTLGAWRAQGHIMWRTAHAGKMGYHLRTEYNKWLIKIGTNIHEINPKGGFLNYGFVKNPYILIKGSIAGAPSRLVRLTEPQRAKKTMEAPEIVYTSIQSKQGN